MGDFSFKTRLMPCIRPCLPDSHIFQSILKKFGEWLESEVMEGGRGWRKVAEDGRRWRMVAEDGKIEFYGCLSKVTATFIGFLFSTISIKKYFPW